jgi:hypothetical protein
MNFSQEEPREERAPEDQPAETHASTLADEHSAHSPKTAIVHLLMRFRERLQVYRVNFRIWRLQRPFWGSILILMAGALVLWGPVGLMRFALFPGSTIWAGLLVGSLLVVMGLIQLFAPSYALITGAVAIVLSLISMFVALGGFVIGMFLGIIGGALGVAWKPQARTLDSIVRTRRKRPWVRLTLRKASKISE